ncbi:hypothetical protein MKX01_003611, partial [Papaver californicum]
QTYTLPGLPIDLRGKRAFIAGIADDNGYGWAIAKSLVAAGAEILVGKWVSVRQQLHSPPTSYVFAHLHQTILRN